MQWVVVLLLIAALGTAVIIGSAHRSSVDCIARAVGTNVSGVSVRVTRSPTHTFYYPSRLRWEWDRALKYLGLPAGTNSYALTATPTPASEVLWVTIAYREMRVVAPLVGEELDDRGHTNALTGPYILLDGPRRATVTRWPLMGDARRYRGKTIRIKASEPFRTMSDPKELAIIEFR